MSARLAPRRSALASAPSCSCRRPHRLATAAGRSHHSKGLCKAGASPILRRRPEGQYCQDYTSEEEMGVIMLLCSVEIMVLACHSNQLLLPCTSWWCGDGVVGAAGVARRRSMRHCRCSLCRRRHGVRRSLSSWWLPPWQTLALPRHAAAFVPERQVHDRSLNSLPSHHRLPPTPLPAWKTLGNLFGFLQHLYRRSTSTDTAAKHMNRCDVQTSHVL